MATLSDALNLYTQFRNQYLGVGIDNDGFPVGQPYQCVDAAFRWMAFCGLANELTPGDAANVWPADGAQSFDNTQDFVPQVGDLFICGPTWGGGSGHIGICGPGCTVDVMVGVEQNNPYPYLSEFSRDYSGVVRFIRLSSFVGIGGAADAAPVLAGNQRLTCPQGANARREPTSESELVDSYNPGVVLNFDGYRSDGEGVGGSRVWLRGAFSGVWVHSSAVTDPGIHDLIDLTPAAPPASDPRTRTTVAVGGNARLRPDSSSELMQALGGGLDVAVDGWAHGESVGGSDVWLHTARSGWWMHSTCFTAGDTAGLPETVIVAPPAPVYSTRPAGAKAWLADVSAVQTPDVMPALRTAGVDGVIIRAGAQGKGYGGRDHLEDSRLREHLAAAQSAGLRVLACYWEGYAVDDPGDEAREAALVLADIDLPVIPLVEDLAGAQASAWLQLWVAAFGRAHHMIYGNAGNLPTGPYASGAMVWQAGYGPEPGSLGDLHQYTDAGRVQGYAGPVDLSCSMTHTVDDLFPAAPQPEQPPTDPKEPPVPDTPTTPTEPTTPVDVPRVTPDTTNAGGVIGPQVRAAAYVLGIAVFALLATLGVMRADVIAASSSVLAALISLLAVINVPRRQK